MRAPTPNTPARRTSSGASRRAPISRRSPARLIAAAADAYAYRLHAAVAVETGDAMQRCEHRDVTRPFTRRLAALLFAGGLAFCVGSIAHAGEAATERTREDTF